MGNQLRAMERHLPYETEVDTGECILPEPQPDRLVFNLPTPDGWMAELTLVLVIYKDGLSVNGPVTHPNSNYLIAT